MPVGAGLDLPTLITEIKAAELTSSQQPTPALATQVFATLLGQAIDKFVRSGKVLTTGTAAAQQGTVT